MSKVIDFKRSVVSKKAYYLNDREKRHRLFCNKNFYVPYDSYREPKEPTLSLSQPAILTWDTGVVYDK